MKTPQTFLLRLLCALLALALLLPCAQGENEYRTLRQGDHGEDVLRFKRAMYWLGYFNTEKVSDQYNGTTTERVKLLQKNNGLEETGVATPELQALVFSGEAVKTQTAPTASPVPAPTASPEPPAGPSAMPADLPETTEEGFLATADDTQEYVYVNADDGLWIYKTNSLSIDLRRYTDKANTVVWFEADIRTSEKTPLTAYLTEGKTPGKTYANPLVMARENRVVLAMTDDNFGDRWRGGVRTGIIVRGGEIIKGNNNVAVKSPRADTFENSHAAFPNLEVLAHFQDGSLQCFPSAAYSGQEYLEMGVTDTFSFGPILVSNGQISEYMLRDEYYTYREPRMALGMIAPHHYVLLAAKGRSSDSKGVYLTWLAEKMLEKGAVEAMNLDGGGTTALIFMGEMLNKSSRNVRATTSIIGFGTSEQVRKK